MNKPIGESQSLVLVTNTAPPIASDGIHDLLLFLICGTTMVLSGLLGFLYFSRKGKQPPARTKQPSARVPFKPGVYKSQLGAKLENDLLRLINYDRQVAERLINREKTVNPGRTEKWYWEKVVSDLERDRK